MKKFICCLLSVLLFTMPVYAGEIKGVEKIGGIENRGYSNRKYYSNRENRLRVCSKYS